MNVRRNYVLYKEGEISKYVYIIKKGQFEMKKYLNEKRA